MEKAQLQKELDSIDIDVLVDSIEGNDKKEETKKKKKKKKKKSKQSVVGQPLDESRVGKELNDVEQEEFESKGSKFVDGVVKELETLCEGDEVKRLETLIKEQKTMLEKVQERVNDAIN